MPSSGCKTCRSEEHTSELQSHSHLVCRLLLEKKKAVSHRVRLVGVDLLPHVQVGAGPFVCALVLFFFFNDTAPPEIYPLSLHDALPIWLRLAIPGRRHIVASGEHQAAGVLKRLIQDRKSTRLNSSHTLISYAVFCL